MLRNFEAQPCQNCPFGPKDDFFWKLYLTDIYLLLVPDHAVKFEKSSEWILRNSIKYKSLQTHRHKHRQTNGSKSLYKIC